MNLYEAWITKLASSTVVRIATIEARSVGEAYIKATALCTGTEFVRGVTPLES